MNLFRFVVLAMAMAIVLLLVALPSAQIGGHSVKGHPSSASAEGVAASQAQVDVCGGVPSVSDARLLYRLRPHESKYAHMAMIDRLSNGSFVVAYQASSHLEGVPDQRLLWMVSADAEGERWPAAPKELYHIHRGKALWSPVLHVSAMRRLQRWERPFPASH